MTPERLAAVGDSWRRTLSGIESPLGQLAYLASLRNQNTGYYEHFGLSERIGPTEVDRLIRQSHVGVFRQWLCFDLRRQRLEVERYLEGIEGPRAEILSNWLCLGPYEAWLPADSRDVERDLFRTDLALVLELIRSAAGVAARDPDS